LFVFVSPANISSASKSPSSFSLYLLSPLASRAGTSHRHFALIPLTVLPFPPLHRRGSPPPATPFHPSPPPFPRRFRSPKIIRNRFETRPFESWSSCRSSGGAAEDRGRRELRRFLLPLLPYRDVSFRGRPPEGMDLFNCFIISTARHGGVSLKSPPASFHPLVVFRPISHEERFNYSRVYSIHIYIYIYVCVSAR